MIGIGYLVPLSRFGGRRGRMGPVEGDYSLGQGGVDSCQS